MLTAAARSELERKFLENDFICGIKKTQLAENLGLTEKQIKKWFKKKRKREAKKMIKNGLSDPIREKLERKFQEKNKISGKEKNELALSLGLKKYQVEIWFSQKRSMIAKRFKKSTVVPCGNSNKQHKQPESQLVLSVHSLHKPTEALASVTTTVSTNSLTEDKQPNENRVETKSMKTQKKKRSSSKKVLDNISTKHVLNKYKQIEKIQQIKALQKSNENLNNYISVLLDDSKLNRKKTRKIRRELEDAKNEIKHLKSRLTKSSDRAKDQHFSHVKSEINISRMAKQKASIIKPCLIRLRTDVDQFMMKKYQVKKNTTDELQKTTINTKTYMAEISAANSTSQRQVLKTSNQVLEKVRIKELTETVHHQSLTSESEVPLILTAKNIFVNTSHIDPVDNNENDFHDVKINISSKAKQKASIDKPCFICLQNSPISTPGVIETVNDDLLLMHCPACERYAHPKCEMDFNPAIGYIWQCFDCKKRKQIQDKRYIRNESVDNHGNDYVSHAKGKMTVGAHLLANNTVNKPQASPAMQSQQSSQAVQSQKSNFRISCSAAPTVASLISEESDISYIVIN